MTCPSGTSATTSWTYNGSTSLTVQTGLSYSPQQEVLITYDASNYMSGTVTSYTTGTGALVVDVTKHTGSGTYNSWSINLAGAVGAQGATGAGSQGATGAQGTTGTAGAQGTTGAQGTAGPSTTINATNNTTTTALYPVMGAAAGSNQTANVTTAKFVFDAAAGNLSVVGNIVNSTGDIAQATL